MASEPEDLNPDQLDALKEMPEWARRYAQNRTLPVVVGLVAFLLGFGVFAGLSYLVVFAYLGGWAGSRPPRPSR